MRPIDERGSKINTHQCVINILVGYQSFLWCGLKMSGRKKVVSSLKDKLNKINSSRKRKSGCRLTNKYCVGTSAISKKNNNSILKYTCKLNSEDRKVMKSQNTELLEKALHRWILQKRSTGQPISSSLLCEEALQINKNIGGDESFVLSNDWLCRFQSRYGIRELETKREKITDGAEPANSIKGEVHETEGRSNKDKEVGPSHVETLQALETALKWFGKQPECNTQSLLQLHRIRDLAALKRKNSLHQMRITNYFNVK